MAETYVTDAARHELALREAAHTGNRHMRRKGRKIFRDVPPPSPWYVFEHPVYGTLGIRPAATGDRLDIRLPSGIPDDERGEVVSWAIAQLKAHTIPTTSSDE